MPRWSHPHVRNGDKKRTRGTSSSLNVVVSRFGFGSIIQNISKALSSSHFIPIPIHASSSPSTMNRHQGHRSGATTRLHHNRPCSSGDDFLDASSKWLRSSNHFPPLQVSSIFNLCTSNSNRLKYASIDI